MSMRKNKSNFQNAAFLSTRDIKILLDFYLRSDLKLEVHTSNLHPSFKLY